MSTTETERYVRITLLTFEGGLWISKKIIYREIDRTPGSPTIDALLLSKKSELTQKRNRREITKRQYETLFPTSGGDTDVEEWDLSLLIKIVVFLFEHSLPGQASRNLNEILRIRNEVVCHARQPSVQDHEFNTHWTDLTFSISSLVADFDTRTNQQASDLVRKLSRGPLDLQSSIERVAQLCRNDEDMEQRLNEVASGLDDANRKLDEVLAGVRELIRIHDTDEEGRCKVEIPMLNSTVVLSGKKEDVVKLAENVLRKVLQSAIDKVEDPNDDEKIRDAVQKFLADIESNGGTADSTESGSIILKIRCETLMGLDNMLNFIRINGRTHRLVGIENVLSAMFQEEIKVEMVLPEDTLDRTKTWIDESLSTLSRTKPEDDLQTCKRSINLGIKCDSAEAAVDVIKYLQSGESANRLNEIAEAVSEVVGDTIKIEATPDVMGFSRALSRDVTIAPAVMEQPRDPGYYRAVSLHLARVLDEVGLNTFDVKERRHARLFLEQMLNVHDRLTGKNYTSYFFGSQTEGATTPGMHSDIDILFCLNDLNVIEDWVDWKQGKMNLLMLHEDTAPGYCRLQVLRRDVPMSMEDLPSEHCTYDTSGRVILKNAFIPSSVVGDNAVRSRPAKSHSDGGRVMDADHVFALSCSSWPAQAAEFTRRRRRHDWPSQRLIEEATTHGVFLVPVGYKLSPTEPLEWMISTSLAERCLMFSLSIVHIKCYVVLKILVKTFIEPRIQKCISSYHCKTALLHCTETTEPGFWQEENLLHCIMRCLEMLRHWVSDLFCPQYMISGENLFVGKVTVYNRDLLVSILTEMIRYNGRAILQVKIDGLGHKLQTRLNTEPTREPALDSLASEALVGHFEFDKHKWISCVMTSYFVSKERKHERSLMQTLCQDIITLRGEVRQAALSKREALQTVIPLLSCWLGSLLASFSLAHNKRLPRQVIQLMRTAADYDVASTLKLASVFYCSGKLRQAEAGLHIVEHHYDSNVMLIVCNCYVKPSNSPLELKGKKTRAKLVAHCVRFSRHEINCAPPALRHEMHRSVGDDIQHRDPIEDKWMVLATVDCLPYLYYLQYLTYKQLGKDDLQRRSLHDLDRCVREDHDFCHLETAWNLLGQCLEEEQDNDGAMACYRASLEIRPRNNAANWLVATLWYRIVRHRGLLPDVTGDEAEK